MYRNRSNSDSDGEKDGFSYQPKHGHHGRSGYGPPVLDGYRSPMPPPMTPAPAPNYHPAQAVPGPKGRKWRADFKDWLAFTAALAILFCWLGGAAYLTAVKKVLPLDYWGAEHFDGRLDNGNYNTLITVAGSLAGALITWAVGQGFKHIIRERFLSPEGLNGCAYEGLSALALQSILWRFRPRAFACLALFALINQFSSATQAAFGTSTIFHTIQHPFYLSRLTDNLPIVSGFAQQSAVLASAGDVPNAVDGAYLSLYPDENNTFDVIVDNVNQAVGPQDPLLSLSVGLSRISTPNSTDSRNPMSADELAILQGAGGALTAYLAAEGYVIDVECGVAGDIQWTRQNIATGLDSFTLAIPDDCGGVTAIYNSTEPFILDSKTCAADNAVYIWYTTLPTQTSPSQVQIYACQVKSGQASIYPAEVSEEFQAGEVTGPGNDTVDLAPVLPYAVSIAGDMFFDTQSLRGNVLLRQTFLQSGAANLSDISVAQISVRVAILTVLAKLGDTLQTTANMVNSTTLTNIVVANMYEGNFVATALKLHLSGSQLAWYLLPAVLLLLVVGLLVYRVSHRSSGDSNFVDPVEVSLVSLRDVHGANTGKWAEYHEANLAATRYRFGVSPTEPNKLILTTDDSIRLAKPRSSTDYL